MSRTSRFMFAILSLMVIGAFAACQASAADDPPANPPARQRGQGGGGRGGNLYTNEAVQKELALTDEQKDSIKKINDDFRASLTGLSQEDRQSKMPELRKGLEDKIGAVLNDTQKARMKEIRIQARGASALADKEVAEALKLTDDQVNKIKDLTDSAMKDMREAFQSAANGGDRTAMREKMTKMRTETSEKLLAVLTADQKTAFEKMQGAKVEGLPQGGAGFGFGGGAGGGRRGGAGNGGGN
ncbi:MAG TPA: hypothetical protein VGY55_18370 [Pirellulales bacterium]|nr:hypothetical protein [Pirellulales bacterium]